MVLNKYRDAADPYLMPLARRLRRVHPDTMSWAAFAFAVPAGALFWWAGEWSYHLLLLAALMVFFNALLDALDGWVARLTGLASRRGDFLDHVLDRYADAFIVGGIAFSAYCDVRIGLLALLGVLFTSYMGTQAQALGLDRNYGGILGRADRMVILFLAPIVQWAWVLVTGDAAIARLGFAGDHPLTVLEVVMIWFAVAGHSTAAWRARASWHDLTETRGPEVGDADRDAKETAGGAPDGPVADGPPAGEPGPEASGPGDRG